MSVTKILLSPSSDTVSPGVWTPDMDRIVTMNGLRRESLSQLCCWFGIQLRFSGWPLFGRKTGFSSFTSLQGLYVFLGSEFVLLHV